MKKIVIFLSFFTFLTSCSSDNKSDSTSDKIVGKWQVVKYSNPSDYLPCDYLGWVNIIDGGKYQEYDACDKSTQNGTWAQKDNLLTIISSTFPIPIVAKIISVSNTSLVLEVTFIDKETVTYKRI